jgi:hypothetical protein
MIIGFSGRKRSGKSACVKAVKDMLSLDHQQCRVDNFADTLKRVVSQVLIPIEYHTPFSDSIGYIEDKKDLLLPCGITVRQALQLVGTDWFRNLWPDVWIHEWKQRVTQYPDYTTVLVGDVRFPNEMKAIQDLGGHVIRLTRAPEGDTDLHESETALDGVGLDTARTSDLIIS